MGGSKRSGLMFPGGHFGVAYLFYSLYSRERFGRPPRPQPALAVVFGSQFADLIDKPLGWGLGVFPGGRAAAHSLLFAAVLTVVVYVVAVVYDRVETGTGFVVAHLTHPVTDLRPRFFLGYPFGSEFLFWPFLSPPVFYYHDRYFEPPAVVELIVTPFTDPLSYFLLQLGVFGGALGLWYVHDCPGLQYVRRVLDR